MEQDRSPVLGRKTNQAKARLLRRVREGSNRVQLESLHPIVVDCLMQKVGRLTLEPWMKARIADQAIWEFCDCACDIFERVRIVARELGVRHDHGPTDSGIVEQSHNLLRWVGQAQRRDLPHVGMRVDDFPESRRNSDRLGGPCGHFYA